MYTNTNYIVAGLILESVTGRPAADEVTRRIIMPLRLIAPAELAQMMDTVEWHCMGRVFGTASVSPASTSGAE